MASLFTQQVDLSQCEPLDPSKTVAHINFFVINTVQFLNRFVSLCDEKLQQASRHISRLGLFPSLSFFLSFQKKQNKTHVFTLFLVPPQQR